MAVTFVAAGTPYSATALGTSFTLNAPAGVAAGDRMYALVACWANGSQKTITASGWTVLNTAFRDMGTDELQLTVLTRYAEAGDPSSWSATASGSVALRVAGVVAYRGVQQTGNRGTSTTGNGSSLATATIENDTANSWRVVFGAYFSGSDDYNISSNETSRRWIESADNSGAVQAATWDSNTGLAVGNYSRTVSRSANWTCAASVILFLEPSTGTPASGEMASTLPAATAGVTAEATASGTMAPSLPAAAFAGTGNGQPVVASGTMAASLPAASAAVSGASAAVGSLDVTVLPAVDFVGETRLFGVRTIVVEPDDRTIEVESRAVAD